LIADETSSGDDGLFALRLPPSHSGQIQIIALDGISTRISLPPSAKPDAAISLGDVSLPELRRVTIRLASPLACQLTAVGPLGRTGMTIVQAVAGVGVHWLAVPEAGEWALSALCDGVRRAVVPLVIVVPADGGEIIIDAAISP
jgi:hypothetical protein